ncbi:MAG: hypothetical protein EKK35_22745 [Bradyrhizobiaceae bacterium]|jgi:hypothetical protein|nr:hypothetical protein [Afipia sp.]OUX62859.1 MAG: hypothetical protein CBB64_02070 [Afipia sp. TMED4]RTL75285.1 MAG: hypothetical protein EKK35_22745 [Bradyrhizobiaceae bacterium]HAO43535.1 hypothetical protein [Afipia sp.]HAP11748.1 hypothetical protein [Afipia sp.]
MFSLIRLIQRWLWPAGEETPSPAQDSTSMADLVRLLETDAEPSDPAGTSKTDAADGSGA